MANTEPLTIQHFKRSISTKPFIKKLIRFNAKLTKCKRKTLTCYKQFITITKMKWKEQEPDTPTQPTASNVHSCTVHKATATATMYEAQRYHIPSK